MGLILVASGILMLISLIVRVNVLDIMLTFWPIILICLGIEILLYLFIRKNDDTNGKLRYDALSILFISFLLIISIGFYAVTYFTGLFESREDIYATFGIMNESVYIEDSATLNGTRELVVLDGINKITALSAVDGELRVEYSTTLRTCDKTYAETMIDGVVRVEHGERAYLRPDITKFYNNQKVSWPIINCVVYLPPATKLDLSQYRGFLEYDGIVKEQIIQNR